MSATVHGMFYRSPGEFCLGSHKQVSEVTDDAKATCPHCGAVRKLTKREPWHEPTLPPHYVPQRSAKNKGDHT